MNAINTDVMTIRSVTTPEELTALHMRWSIDLDWNPGLYDGETYYELDREGFLAGSIRGTPVAAIAATHTGRSGHIGLFIVRPEFRGRGYAHRLFDEAMDYLQDCDYVILDSVSEQKDFYLQKGFRPGHINSRYKAVATGREHSSLEKLPAGIIPLSCVPFEMTASYCAPYFPGPREEFFRAWLGQPEAISFGKLNRDGSMQGVIVARKALDGYRLGPLFAEDSGTAGDLMDSLMFMMEPGENIYMEIPSNNPAARPFRERYSMEENIPLVSMIYSKKGVRSIKPCRNIYAITASNIG
ncbi:MAG: GNAT family N-acetyltransferase [bacterium]|nr:GNAT family N-acetyltransferase [bacterium]